MSNTRARAMLEVNRLPSDDFRSFSIAAFMRTAHGLKVIGPATTAAACILAGGVRDWQRECVWQEACKSATSDILADLLLFNRVYFAPNGTQADEMRRCGVDKAAYDSALVKRSEFEHRHSTPQPIVANYDEKSLFVAILAGYAPESFVRLSSGGEWTDSKGVPHVMGDHSIFFNRSLKPGTTVAASKVSRLGVWRLSDVTLIEPHVAKILGISFPDA